MMLNHSLRGDEILMMCPFCFQDIQELWQPFCALTDWQGNALPEPSREVRTVTKPKKRLAAHIKVQPYWTVCPKCQELLVQIRKVVSHASTVTASPEHLAKHIVDESCWLALPHRKPAIDISSLVPSEMARDYREAHQILDDSPRMSSVLSRRILADLLEQYAGAKGYTLAAQIDKFIADTSHPARHRENLHYLREIGDFSAHTKKDTNGNIIEVTPEEAEWTLRVVLGLFDYFIVDPETDKVIRTRIDEKLKEAGRKPIKKVAGS